MDSKDFFEKIKLNLKKFWKWLSPYLSRGWAIFKKHWKRFHLTKILILTFLSVALVFSVWMNFLARSADVEQLRAGLEQTTTIVDANGNEAGSISPERGEFVSIENIDQDIQDAVISTEDQRFYNHRGFDPIGIARAALGYVINRGEIVGGGSTITQQLAKNAYLSSEQTITRKLQELFLAIEIEKHYTKDEILEMYLNNSYFGNGVWGVHDASLRYFGKDVQDITVGEAATLAGMLKAPSLYNPIDNYDATIDRRNTVLYLMEGNDAITEAERNGYVEEEIQVTNAYTPSNEYNYPYYFDSIITEAVSKFGLDEEELLNRGYTIHTSLDQNIQNEMDAVMEQDHLFDTSEDGTEAEAASIAIDPQTGGIKAIRGGRNDYTLRGYNRAIQMKRQPGSTIKPLSVFAPALESGFSIASMLTDEEITYGEGDSAYTPTNLSGEYSGEMPMYEALAYSINSPAVWLLNEIGIQTGIDKLEDFGIDVAEEDEHLGAISLGGMNSGASVLDMTSAFSTFANEGVQMEPHFITSIVAPNGEVIFDNTDVSSDRILSEQVNEDMNRMLLGVFDYGTASANQPAGYRVAGKTGTTENPAGTGAADHWIVGYTPDLVVGTWSGFDQTSNTNYLDGYASGGVGMVFKEQMERMLPYTNQTDFSVEPPEPENQNQEENGNFLDNFNIDGEQLRETGETIIRGAGEIGRRAGDFIQNFSQ